MSKDLTKKIISLDIEAAEVPYKLIVLLKGKQRRVLPYDGAVAWVTQL